MVVRRYIDFPILLIPTPLVSALFCSSIPTFCSFYLMFFVLVPVYFCNLFKKNFPQYKHTYGRLRVSHSSHMKAARNVFIHEEAHTNVRFISCDGHQLYDFKERGVDLEVEGLRYIEMHHRPHTYWARLLQGAYISNKRAESMCPCENMV